MHLPCKSSKCVARRIAVLLKTNMAVMLRLHNPHLDNAAMQQLHTRRWVSLMRCKTPKSEAFSKLSDPPLRLLSKLPVMSKR